FKTSRPPGTKPGDRRTGNQKSLKSSTNTLLSSQTTTTPTTSSNLEDLLSLLGSELLTYTRLLICANRPGKNIMSFVGIYTFCRRVEI
ncbi:hypothetical protein, partial [Bifidobacterium bohemicum]|uniref:hypothetical protein n=1 Tax=Bifidobacterium bohemicum TaxID=638617 RepID=UPI001C538E94